MIKTEIEMTNAEKEMVAEAIKFGWDSAIEHLSKQSEFREWYILIHDTNPTLTQVRKTETPVHYLKVSHHTQIKVIDIAALAAKNLRIAELESLNNALMIQSQTRGEQLAAKTEAIGELVNLLSSMHIDEMGWNLQKTDVETLVGWHKQNNEKIEKYLSKIGKITK